MAGKPATSPDCPAVGIPTVGRYEGFTGARARSRWSAPASLQRVASSGRVVPTAAPERHPSPTPEPRVPASVRGGGAAARPGRTALGSHSGVRARPSHGGSGTRRPPPILPGYRPPWRTRGTGSELGSGSLGASCRTRECGEPRSGADSSAAPRFPEAPAPSHFRPRIRRDYPLDLSISASGGKETN